MINNKPLQLSDPQIFAEYTTNGLTYKSDDTNIIPRDSAGSIIIEPTGNKNILVIEPIVKRISNNSFLKVYNTAFQYYKFPVATIESADSGLDVNLDLDFIDTISTRYTIPYQEYPAGKPNSYHKLNTSYESDWFTGDSNIKLSGFIELPFTGPNQLTPYTFTLTPDTIDILRNSNKTIKFFIQMQGNSSVTGNTAFEMKLIRKNAELYRNPDLALLHTETKGQYNSGDYPVLSMEYVLDLNEIYQYDTFSVQAVAGAPSWYLGDNTVWNIDLIDIPENGETGVVSISSKTSLKINGNTVIDGRE